MLLDKKVLALGILLTLAGCADATRTVPVLVVEERTVSGDVPRGPDTVISEYHKNNFLGNVKSVPLPPPRPYNLGKSK